MDCHFPWSAGLWEAENASSFSRIAMSHSTELPLPPLKDVVTQLLETPTSNDPIPWGLSVSVEHLLILIYGMLMTESSESIKLLRISQQPLTPSHSKRELAY